MIDWIRTGTCRVLGHLMVRESDPYHSAKIHGVVAEGDQVYVLSNVVAYRRKCVRCGCRSDSWMDHEVFTRRMATKEDLDMLHELAEELT